MEKKRRETGRSREVKTLKMIRDLIVKMSSHDNVNLLTKAYNLATLWCRVTGEIPQETCNLMLGRKKSWPTKRAAIKKRIKQLASLKEADVVVSDTLGSIWNQEGSDANNYE